MIKPKTDIVVSRVYDADEGDNRYRILVDRLWPRGVKREDLRPDEWLKEVAPSNELRRWFNHDLERWEEFQDRYAEELRSTPEVWLPLLKIAQQRPVRLLYAARDQRHNNAVALKAFLESRSNDECDE